MNINYLNFLKVEEQNQDLLEKITAVSVISCLCDKIIIILKKERSDTIKSKYYFFLLLGLPESEHFCRQ